MTALLSRVRFILEPAMWGKAAAAAALTILIVTLMWAANWFTSLRLLLNDLYFTARPVSGNVVVVALDEASHNRFGRNLSAWPRTVFADMLDKLILARVVAIDVLLAEETAEDSVLVDAIDRLRGNSEERETRLVLPLVGMGNAPDPSTETAMVSFYQVIRPVSSFLERIDMVGFANTFPDVDGTVRRQLTRVNQADGSYSFPLAAYMAYLRISPRLAQEIVRDEPGVLVVANRRIPIDEHGLWVVNFAGPPSSTQTPTFPIYSLLNVLEPDFEPLAFQDKIVLVGLINTTGATDVYRVPTSFGGALMAGVEIHANAIESLLQDRLITEQPRNGQWLTLAAMALVASAVFTLLPWYGRLPAGFLLALVWITWAVAEFNSTGYMRSLFHPLLALLMAGLISLFIDIAQEIDRRRQAELLLDSVVDLTNQRLAPERIASAIAEDIQRLTGSPSGQVLLVGRDAVPIVRRVWGQQAHSQAFTEAADNALRQRKVGIRGPYVTAPVLWQDQPLAVILAERPSTLSRRWPVQRLLKMMVERIAPGLDNALLYAELDAQRRLLSTVLEESPAAVFMLNAAGSILLNNPAALELLDASPTASATLWARLRATGADETYLGEIIQDFQAGTLDKAELRLRNRTLDLQAAHLKSGAWVIIINDVTALAELNRLKTQMIRMASHDLKKPLARVVGYGGLLLDNGMGKLADEDRMYVERIADAGQEMLHIINDLLNLEQLRGRRTFFAVTSMNAVLQTVALQRWPDAEAKGQQLVLELGDSRCCLHGDTVLLQQLFGNLVENAIKYTPMGGCVRLGLRFNGEQLEIDVADTGLGIPEEARPHIFEEFFRARTQETADIPGTGLGLSLAKAITEVHHGTIRFESQVGMGTTFTVCFPRVECAHDN